MRKLSSSGGVLSGCPKVYTIYSFPEGAEVQKTWVLGLVLVLAVGPKVSCFPLWLWALVSSSGEKSTLATTTYHCAGFLLGLRPETPWSRVSWGQYLLQHTCIPQERAILSVSFRWFSDSRFWMDRREPEGIGRGRGAWNEETNRGRLTSPTRLHSVVGPADWATGHWHSPVCCLGHPIILPGPQFPNLSTHCIPKPDWILFKAGQAYLPTWASLPGYLFLPCSLLGAPLLSFSILAGHQSAPFLLTRSQGTGLKVETLKGIILLSTVEQLRDTWLNFASKP